MKTIGILGGMSSASTALYYKQLNLGVRARLGGLHSAQILLRSLDFALIAELQAKNDWSTAGALLNQEALALERGVWPHLSVRGTGLRVERGTAQCTAVTRPDPCPPVPACPSPKCRWGRVAAPRDEHDA
jgi:hypothetical protein